MAINPKYSYTQDDLMQPVYCTVCRQHIPKAISNAGSGVCPDCVASANAAAASTAAQQAALQQQAQQAHFNLQTGMGKCPQCQSTNIAEFENTAKTQASAYIGGGCCLIILSVPLFCTVVLSIIGLILVIVGIILAIIGMSMNTKKKIGPSRICNFCGYRWLV